MNGRLGAEAFGKKGKGLAAAVGLLSTSSDLFALSGRFTAFRILFALLAYYIPRFPASIGFLLTGRFNSIQFQEYPH